MNFKAMKIPMSEISVLLISVLAFLMLEPFFIWQTTKLLYVVYFLVFISLYFFNFKQAVLNHDLAYTIILLIFFLLYIAFLPMINGKIFLLPLKFVPIVTIFLYLKNTEIIRCFNWFFILFAVSLIPAIVVWFLMINQINLSFEKIYLNKQINSLDNIYYLKGYGAVISSLVIHKLHSANFYITRLCGMYNEPGLVGTIAALLLAADRYRLKNIRNFIVFTGGLLSLSLAFYILSIIWFLFKRSLITTALLIIGFLIFKLLYYSVPFFHEIIDIAVIGKFRILIQSHIEIFDDRGSVELTKLFNYYLSSNVSSIAFGLGANATNVYASGTASWKSLFINFGVFGVLLLISYLFVGFFAIKKKYSNNKVQYLYYFSVVYLLSLYQRNAIWIMPYVLIYLGGALNSVAIKASDNLNDKNIIKK